MSKWIKVIKTDDIPSMGSRLILLDNLEIAVFKTNDDEIFAIDNECPHKQGKLSEGLVHEHKVTCPLHNWVIDLESGQTQGEEVSCSKVYDTMIDQNILFIKV